MYLCIYLSIYLSIGLSIYLQVWKRSYSVRPPHLFKLTTSKRQHFCETSLKNGKLSAELMASYQCVLPFFYSICLKCSACHKKVMPGHTKRCTCHTKSSSQNCRSDAPKCSFWGNQRPDLLTSLMNMSLLLRLPREMQKTLTSCSLLTRCTSPCACHTKRHLNVQRCPEPVIFFDFENVLRATTACTFSSSQLPKVVRTWGVLCILTSKCASRHNGVQLFISHLARWLRARRFSEPTFRPSGATNHWKNTVIRNFPFFSRTCIFFLLTLALLWSSLFCSSLLWLFPPLLFHLSILSEVWLLNFLR